MDRFLIDTGPLVAYLNRRDRHHTWSVAQTGQMDPPLYTCEAVIAEAHHLLQDVPNGRDRLIALLDAGAVLVSFSFEIHRTRVHELMLKYADLPMDFADACLVCMVEQQASAVFTVDADFHVYRVHGNQRISTLMP